MKIERLGMMGGSFNPIHHGHLVCAEFACEQLRLDRVLFVPTAVSPLKETSDLAPPRHRLAMVKLAIEEHAKFAPCDIEVRRGGVSYTMETIEALGTDAQVFVIIGDDSVATLPKWYRIHELAERVTFGVVGRPGHYPPAPPGPWKLRRVRVPLMELSGTMIRERARRGLSVRYLVPDAVDRYIQRHKLYR